MTKKRQCFLNLDRRELVQRGSTRDLFNLSVGGVLGLRKKGDNQEQERDSGLRFLNSEFFFFFGYR